MSIQKVAAFNMLKLNKKKGIVILLAIICIVLATPFINGLGCNSSFIIRNPFLGSLYGKCEYGRVQIAVNHGVTLETYSASGIIGFWQGRYFIILTSRDVHANKNNKPTKDVDVVPRPFYYRDFYTGNLLPGEREGELYVIYFSPEPTIGQILLHGKLGFLP